MKNRILTAAALILVSAFFNTATVKAGDAVKRQEQPQPQDQRQSPDNAIKKTDLQTGDKTRPREQGGEQARLMTGGMKNDADDGKTAMMPREKTGRMKPAGNPKDVAAKEKDGNAGNRKAPKTREMKHERMRAGANGHSSGGHGSRSGGGGQGHRASGMCK